MEGQIIPQNSLLIEMKVNSVLRSRRIHMSDEIDRETIFEILYFLNRLREIDKNTGIKLPIEIVIDSYGGQIYHINSLLSLIQEMKEDNYTIITTVTGVAMSCGFLLLLIGSERNAYRYSTSLCHQPSSSSWGTLKELEDNLKETTRLWELMKRIIKENTNITEEKLEQIKREKEDWILTPEDCLKYGVIDNIL